MITVPTKAELKETLRAYLGALLPEISTGPDTDAAARIEMLVDALYGLHRQVYEVQRDVFPATASDEGVLLHAQTRLRSTDGNPRKSATTSSGGTLRVYGTASSTVGAGATLSHQDGTRYKLSEGGTIPSSPPYQVDLELESISTGTAANKEAPDKLTFESPPAGITAEADLTADLTGALDQETYAELLVRLLDAIQNPPAGGRFSDYRQWATDVVGVLSAYCYGPSSAAPTGRRGLGVVDVAILRRGTGSGRIPSSDTQQDVVDNIEDNRPCTTKDIPVLLPTAVEQDWDIKVAAETGYTFDWSSVTSYTVSAWVAGTRELTWSAALPSTVVAGKRIMVNGELKTIESVSASDKTILTTGFTNAPTGGEGIYPGGPLSEPVQQAIQDYHDSLGPARGAASDPEQDWDDTIRLAEAYRVIQAVAGVEDSEIATPSANVVPDDNVATTGDVELLVYGKITVRPL